MGSIISYPFILQVAQIVYWLSLSTWFGCVLFLGIAAPIIFRTVQEGDPLLPTVLSVNLEGQHGTLLAGSIVSNLIAMLIRIEWICALALVPAMIVQALALSTHTSMMVVRFVLYCLSVLVLLYQWWVLVPRTAEARKKYIDHADEPEVANPAKDQFDRYHGESVTALTALLFLLLGLVLLSASSLYVFIPLPSH
jgi:hypothetical protein